MGGPGLRGRDALQLVPVPPMPDRDGRQPHQRAVAGRAGSAVPANGSPVRRKRSRAARVWMPMSKQVPVQE